MRFSATLFLLSWAAFAQDAAVKPGPNDVRIYTGVVVQQPSGKPIAGYKIRVHPFDNFSALRTYETDAKGHFEIRADAHTRVDHLEVSHTDENGGHYDGYELVEWQAVRWKKTGPDLYRMDGVKIVMCPLAHLRVRVVDENDRPFADGTVWIAPAFSVPAAQRGGAIREKRAITNKDGVTNADLSPGAYQVLADPSFHHRSDDADRRYAIVYYPNVVDAAHRGAVSLRAGTSVEIALKMPLVPAYEVKGNLKLPTSQDNVKLWLQRTQDMAAPLPDDWGETYMAEFAPKTGAFSVKGVPAGDYDMLVEVDSVLRLSRKLSVRGPLSIEPALALLDPIPIRGILVLADGRPRNWQKAQVKLNTGIAWDAVSQQVAADGSFVIPSVERLIYSLLVDLPSEEQLICTKILVDGNPLDGSRLDLTGRSSPVELQFIMAKAERVSLNLPENTTKLRRDVQCGSVSTYRGEPRITWYDPAPGADQVTVASPVMPGEYHFFCFAGTEAIQVAAAEEPARFPPGSHGVAARFPESAGKSVKITPAMLP